METLLLVEPTEEHEEAARDYLEEHTRAGETDLHGAALLEQLPFEEWLALVRGNKSECTCAPGWVSASTFFAVRQSDGKIVGVVDIRHRLNDFLRTYGGHIGYGVRPSERKRGYATSILRLALDYAHDLGLNRVMLACNKDNVASRKTIEANGGVLEREFQHKDDNVVQVFWIDTSAR